jgi:hypothetical protein
MVFRFKCLSKLYQDLGRYDAMVEFNEVAIRSFLHNACSSGSFNSFLAQQAQTVGIRVDAIDLVSFRSRISQSYLVSVYQSVAVFLDEFRKEHIELYGKSWDTGESSGDLLTKTLQQIGKISDIKSALGDHNLEIFAYYRKVRNRYAHSGKSDTNPEKDFKALEPYLVSIASDFPGLHAPNSFNDLSFDAFLLFTRVVKVIAERLVLFCKPSDEEVVQYYERHRIIDQLKGSLNRKRNALITDMENRFGIQRLHAEKLLNSVTFR